MIMKERVLIFRPLRKEDIDELHELLNNLSERAKLFFHPHPFDKKTLKELCSSERDHYFVLILDGKIIGYSMLRLFHYTVPSLGCCIRNGYENRGYGTLLVRWTLEEAKRLGYKEVILHVYEENKAARRIYEKVGFKIIERNDEKKELRMSITL